MAAAWTGRERIAKWFSGGAGCLPVSFVPYGRRAVLEADETVRQRRIG
jgi:hypothetical protein